MTTANRSGTMCEQVRFRMGYKSPAERKAEGITDTHVCCNCKSHYVKEIPSRDGGCPNYSSYCGHPHAYGEFGHATRATGSCDKWERKQ